MANEVAKFALALLGQAGRVIAVGEQTRYSHAQCGDTRSRLYVKRVVNEKGQGGVLAFCHNCSSGGAAYETGPAHYIAPVPSIVNLGPDKPALPEDYEPANGLAIQYMDKYGFAQSDTRFFGVGWSENYQRIVLPVEDGPPGTHLRIKGCQLRRVGDYGPKYITMRPTAEPLECVWWNSRVADITVITEDLLSAWRVWQAGYNAVPLLGAHVRPERLAKMIGDGHKDWVIWLDNDKPEINDAARYMRNLVAALGGNAWISGSNNEPKHYNVQHVQAHIQSASV